MHRIFPHCFIFYFHLLKQFSTLFLSYIFYATHSVQIDGKMITLKAFSRFSITSFFFFFHFSLQFSSVTLSCPTLCDPMNRSTPGFPVHHQLPEFTQTHVHWVSDAIQPSHPLSFPSFPAPNPSQNQSLFQWVNSSHKVAKVLEFQL